MEATNLGCCKLSWKPISMTLIRSRRGPPRRTIVGMSLSAHHRDGDYLGKSVDESMIVLRLRIKEMNMMEESHVAPSDWMELEKNYYAHYDKDVCEAVGLFQCYLMSLRPSVALGMFALVALSVMISFGVGLFHALEIAKSLIIMCTASAQVRAIM